METTVQALPGGVTAYDRQWAAMAHGSALVLAFLSSWAVGIAGAVAAFVVWMIVRERSPFAAAHAREALNFNVSMFIYAAISLVVLVFTLGLGIILLAPLWAVLALVLLVCSLIATFKAYDGNTYRYPLTMRLFR